MDLDRPQYPASLVDRMKKELPFSCIGCEHLRALPDRTTLCTYGGSPRKVNVIDPLVSNRNCKHNQKDPGTLDGPAIPTGVPPRE